METTNLELLAREPEDILLQYFSIPSPDPKDRNACLVYAAQVSGLMSSADHRIAEMIGGDVIQLRHVFAHRVDVRQEEPDEYGKPVYFPADRVVLIEADGTTYEGTSVGAIKSLATLFQLPGIGKPETWTEPLPVRIKQIEGKNNRRTFSIEVYVEEVSRKKKK